MTGLSVSDVVGVSVQLTPTAAGQRNFGTLLILGDSNVIDVGQRMRLYTSAAAVAADFGGSAPEYLAASLFFGQNPTPAQCYVGRWASANTSGVLRGGTLSAAAQLLANFTAVTNGGVQLVIDGTAHNLSGLSFAGQTNLNGVAAIVQAALTGSGTVTWDPVNGRFVVSSSTNGTSSSVVYAAAGAGTDISALLGLTQATGAVEVNGQLAETPLAAVTTLANLSSSWYGLQIASTVGLQQSDVLAIAGFIETNGISHIYGVTTMDPNTLNASSTTDTASMLQATGYKRTFIQYSSTTHHASAAAFGVAFTVDFDGIDTTITLMFKQEAGVVSEQLTESAAATLLAKNCNVFVLYNNGTAIVQPGVMTNGYYFDETHGTDWLQNDLQTIVFDDFLEAPKIPQTDAGVNRLVTDINAGLSQSVQNGLVAPGVWTGPSFGALNTGDTLTTGYYTYAPAVSTQTAAARAARQSPLIQAAIKLAGAIHYSNVLVSVNR